MPAEPVRVRCIRGEMILMRPTPIVDRVVLAIRVMRATMPRILGAFLICTEMCGSGRRTGTELTVREHRPIPQVRHRARPGSHGVVPGPTTERTCVLLSAAATPRAAAPTTLASVLVSKKASNEEARRRVVQWVCCSREVIEWIAASGFKETLLAMTNYVRKDDGYCVMERRSAAGLDQRGGSPNGPCQQAEPRCKFAF